MRAEALCKGRMIPRLFSLLEGGGSTLCRGLVRISNGRTGGAKKGKRDPSQKRLGMTWLVEGRGRLINFGVHFAAYGALPVSSVESAGRIAEEGMRAGATVINGNRSDLIFGGSSGIIGTDNHIAKSVAVFAT